MSLLKVEFGEDFVNIIRLRKLDYVFYLISFNL